MNSEPAAALQRQTQTATLSHASSALWLATLSLMTAYMRMAAPAHRYLLAARIARNFDVLRELDCFSADTRARFARLAVHWRDKADALSPNGTKPRGALARLQRLLARGMH